MASTHASLDAAATERKARLAKLRSLKRKHPDPDTENNDVEPVSTIPVEISEPANSDSATKYLSGRNYDTEIRGPKLGFENAPNENAETLEDRAAVLAQEAREKEAQDSKEEKPLDLFTLQPRKPNWDLKRDVARKIEVLNARTDNAIARLVRERLEGQKRKEKDNPNPLFGRERDGGGENVGIGGVELVEGVHMREREDEAEEMREREVEEEVI